MARERLLIPVVFPDPDLYPLSDSFVRELAGFDVTLLGYWEVPEETSIEDARRDHETDAEAVLYEIAAQFSHRGASTDIQLHFGPAGDEERELRDRIAEQTHADGVIVPNDPTLLRRVLVAVRGERNADRMLDLVGGLDPDTTLQLELFHVAEDEAAAERAEEWLDEMWSALRDRGFADVDLSTTVEVGDDPAHAIVRRARDHELVVMGETEQPDIEDEVFGPKYERIAERTELPIVVALADDR